MRTHEEFKKEVIKRSYHYKLKRNRRIIHGFIVCLIILIPFSSSFYNKYVGVEVCEEKSPLVKDNQNKYEQNYYNDEVYTFRNKENIDKIKVVMNDYEWISEEIEFTGDGVFIQLIDNKISEIRIIDNKIIYKNQWVELDEYEMKEFKLFIDELYEEE